MHEGWTLIRDFIDKLVTKGQKGAIYRGQAEFDWNLNPSGFRGSSVGLSNNDRLNDWKWRAARYAAPVPQDAVEWLMMAQHYGMPTPLLDWTASPLVALYFACVGEKHEQSDGCVWVSHKNNFQILHDSLNLDPFDLSPAKPFLINAVGKNLRSTAQDSLFTLHHANTEDFIHNRLFKVPSASKSTVLDQLSKLGISGHRLLHDVGYLVEEMIGEYWGRFVSLQR